MVEPEKLFRGRRCASVLRGALMPRISYFYGIAIYMYFADHNPPLSRTLRALEGAYFH
jgi:hypothetical protein